MSSNSAYISSRVQPQASSRQRGPQPGDCRSHHAKKRAADKSPERPYKRRRSRQRSRDNTDTPDTTGVSEKRRKRRTSRRKSRNSRRNSRRNRRRHRGRRNHHRSEEDPSPQAPTEASSYVRPGASRPATTAPTNSTAAFNAKYVEGTLLGKGGNGSVFAGHRRHDNLPVAIKHIQGDTRHLPQFVDLKNRSVPLEVALMLKLRGTSAVVALLDWYDLKDELILILERPVPCMDLLDYMDSTGSTLQEHEVKIIVKQLVDAFSEVHSKGVFHKDIKPDNILCKTGPDGPSIRIIDFGNGTFITEDIYATPQGTDLYNSPEWLLHGWYRPEPTTVWQLGVVVFVILHGDFPFQNTTEIIRDDVSVRDDLSFDCKDLLLTCLNKKAAARPSLETLRHHPWLR